MDKSSIPKEWYDPSQRDPVANGPVGTSWAFSRGSEPVFENFSNRWPDNYTRDEEENGVEFGVDDEHEDEDEYEEGPELF